MVDPKTNGAVFRRHYLATSGQLNTKIGNGVDNIDINVLTYFDGTGNYETNVYSTPASITAVITCTARVALSTIAEITLWTTSGQALPNSRCVLFDPNNAITTPGTLEQCMIPISMPDVNSTVFTAQQFVRILSAKLMI